VSKNRNLLLSRKVYWSDMGGDGIRPKIAEMEMDGNPRNIVTQRRVDMPIALALDDMKGDLFWVEGRRQQVG